MISPLEQQVLQRIDDKQLIAWVQELTRIPSVWRPERGKGGSCRPVGGGTLPRNGLGNPF
ncbi:MAG: hypothetical protein R2932_60340 [Caldilineaceae bacterium]